MVFLLLGCLLVFLLYKLCKFIESKVYGSGGWLFRLLSPILLPAWGVAFLLIIIGLILIVGY